MIIKKKEIKLQSLTDIFNKHRDKKQIKKLLENKNILYSLLEKSEYIYSGSYENILDYSLLEISNFLFCNQLNKKITFQEYKNINTLNLYFIAHIETLNYLREFHNSFYELHLGNFIVNNNIPSYKSNSSICMLYGNFDYIYISKNTIKVYPLKEKEEKFINLKKEDGVDDLYIKYKEKEKIEFSFYGSGVNLMFHKFAFKTMKIGL